MDTRFFFEFLYFPQIHTNLDIVSDLVGSSLSDPLSESNSAVHAYSKLRCFVTVVSGVIGIFLSIFLGLKYFSEFLQVQYDDSFITYRYAFNLAHGDGLRFNPGDNSNSASSLLFVLLLALIYFVTRIDLMNIATMINLLSVGIMSSLIVWIFVRRGVNPRNVIAGLAMMFMFTSSGRLVYWTFSGMETAFFMMLLAIAIFTTSDYITDSRYVTGRRTWLLIALVLLSLTRVEGAIVATALGGLVVLAEYFNKRKKFDKQNLWILVVAPFTFASQLLFYWVYYGSPITDPIGFKDRVQYYQRTPKSALDSTLSFIQDEGLWFVGLSFIFITILLLLKQQAITARITGAFVSLVLLFLFALRSPNSDELRYELVLLVPMMMFTAELASSLINDKRSLFILIFTFLTVGSIFSVNSGVKNAVMIEARTSRYQYVQSARIEASKWLELNTTPGTRVISSDIGALAYYNPSNI